MARTGEGGVDTTEADRPLDDAQLHYEITEFLNRESALLDDREYREWHENYLHEDVGYQVPKIIEREAGSDKDSYSHDIYFFDENYATFRARIDRFEKEYAWAENPPSRFRHFITNVLVDRTDADGEYDVRSNVLVYRNRGDTHEHDLLSGDRQDRIVHVDGEGYLLKDRDVYLDSTVIGSKNLPFFF